MNYCPYCDAALPEGVFSFCPVCGNPLVESERKQEKRKQRNPKAGPAKKKKKRSQRGRHIGRSPENKRNLRDGDYDGYYDDVRPLDDGEVRQGLDKDVIKRIVGLLVGVLVVIIACVAIMYLI